MSMLNITHFPVNKITENRGYYGELWVLVRPQGKLPGNRRFYAKMADYRLASRNSLSSTIAPRNGGHQAAGCDSQCTEKISAFSDGLVGAEVPEFATIGLYVDVGVLGDGDR